MKEAMYWMGVHALGHQYLCKSVDGCQEQVLR